MAQSENISKHERTVSIEGFKVQSKSLLGDTKELIIIHNEEEYKLRQTGNGKLILTK